MFIQDQKIIGTKLLIEIKRSSKQLLDKTKLSLEKSYT